MILLKQSHIGHRYIQKYCQRLEMMEFEKGKIKLSGKLKENVSNSKNHNEMTAMDYCLVYSHRLQSIQSLGIKNHHESFDLL